MVRKIQRYSDYDDGARQVLVLAGKLAEADGRQSIGLAMLARGLLEVAPEARSTLADAAIHARHLELIDDESTATAGATEAFKAVLDAADSAALLAGRKTVTPSDLAAGLVAVTKRAPASGAT